MHHCWMTGNAVFIKRDVAVISYQGCKQRESERSRKKVCSKGGKRGGPTGGVVGVGWGGAKVRERKRARGHRMDTLHLDCRTPIHRYKCHFLKQLVLVNLIGFVTGNVWLQELWHVLAAPPGPTAVWQVRVVVSVRTSFGTKEERATNPRRQDFSSRVDC
jgi:hypothetical protein